MLTLRKNGESRPLAPTGSLGMSAPQPSASPQPSWQLGARPGERVAPSMIGADLTIMGNLVSRGEVHVDGEIQGDIHGNNIVIGEKAKISGSIIAQEIVICGHVIGSIRGKRVMLQSTSRVEGDVFHQALLIEQGAFFEGKSRRSEDPATEVPRPAIPDLSTRSNK